MPDTTRSFADELFGAKPRDAAIVGCKDCRHFAGELCRHPDAAKPDFLNGGQIAPVYYIARSMGPCGVEASLFEPIP